MRNLLIRAMVVSAVLLILGIASGYLSSLVGGRLRFQSEAQRSIAASYPGSQTLVAPVFSVWVEEHYSEEKYEGTGKTLRRIKVAAVRKWQHYFLPTQLKLNQDQTIQDRKRGIFKVATYQSLVNINGTVKIPLAADFERTQKDGVIKIIPRLGMHVIVSDARGLSDITATVAQLPLQLDPSITRTSLGPTAKLEMPIPSDEFTITSQQPFEIKLALAGTGSVFFTPLARENWFELNTTWPHPSFVGAVVPTSSSKTQGGYQAKWKIDSISSEAPTQVLASVTADKNTLANHLQTIGVNLIDPVDIYALNSRANKYDLLFVILVLSTFILFELFKGLSIHPLQYLMIGFSMLIFFLLLLSFSEHIGFDWAYLAAAGCCSALITVYAGYILASWRRALPLGLGLVALYCALFQILQSEQIALLMASILLFVVLATVMLATRKTNWFDLFNRPPLLLKTGGHKRF